MTDYLWNLPYYTAPNSSTASISIGQDVYYVCGNGSHDDIENLNIYCLMKRKIASVQKYIGERADARTPQILFSYKNSSGDRITIDLTNNDSVVNLINPDYNQYINISFVVNASDNTNSLIDKGIKFIGIPNDTVIINSTDMAMSETLPNVVLFRNDAQDRCCSDNPTCCVLS